MPESLARLMDLKIKSLKSILEIQETGGGKVRYKGHVETMLGFPQIKNFEEP